jgi:lipoprotein-releasing system ATP-binding protein
MNRPVPTPPAEAGAPTDAIVAREISKEFVGGDGTPLRILQDTDLTVRAGESLAIVGQSGAGKSTLLHILGALDRPTKGQVWIGGEAIGSLSEDALAQLRNKRIGFVFQFHHLLREFTALENVMMPQLIAGVDPSTARKQARELLSQVGLGQRLEHRPAQLSGGEQQRVAVARGLANRPLALLADEPSGNLDPYTSERLHDLLFDVSREHASAMVLVTHNRELAARADRVLRVEDGHLVPIADYFDARAERSSG